MLNVLLFIGKILITTLAVFGLTRLLNRRNNPLRGKIIEGEVIENDEDKI